MKSVQRKLKMFGPERVMCSRRQQMWKLPSTAASSLQAEKWQATTRTNCCRMHNILIAACFQYISPKWCRFLHAK